MAVAADLAIYGLARLAGVTMIVRAPDGGAPARLPLGAVVAAAVVGIAVAAVAWALMGHFAPAQARLGFPALVALFVLLSLSAPLSLDTGAATKLVLVAMHVTTGIVAIVGLGRPAGQAPP